MNSIRYFLILTLVTSFAAGCSQPDSQEPRVIDETGNTENIVQTIKIDRVWAGHPVGFCLLTRGNRQYIAYYNANRNMVVGQRNLDDDEFQLHIMPATSRDTHGGTSTVLGWDSHNSVTLGIDEEGYIHLSGNMHVHPLTYFRSTELDDITTLEQVMEMVGTEEDKCTYPKFMNDRDGQLIFHYRDGGSGDGNEIYNYSWLSWKEMNGYRNKLATGITAGNFQAGEVLCSTYG